MLFVAHDVAWAQWEYGCLFERDGQPLLAGRKEVLLQDKRMFAHDYTRVSFYMITLVTAGRRALFGACCDNRVQLSPAGEVVERRWQEIPSYRPAIKTNTLVVMPDHLHGIVYVKEPLPKPVGETIRGFKSGATSALPQFSQILVCASIGWPGHTGGPPWRVSLRQ